MTGMVCAVRRDLIERTIPNQIIPHDMFYLPLLSLIGYRGKAINAVLVSYRQHANQLFGVSIEKRNTISYQEDFQNHRSFLKRRGVIYQEILHHAGLNAVKFPAKINIKVLNIIRENLSKRIVFFEKEKLGFYEKIYLILAYLNPLNLLLFSVRSIVRELLIFYNRR
tara:strand:- start:8 stop:508 length:501 start_codon:yes stop_codon:yes gene_type:complete